MRLARFGLILVFICRLSLLVSVVLRAWENTLLTTLAVYGITLFLPYVPSRSVSIVAF